MTAYLTSFKAYRADKGHLDIPAYSIAVYQPKGFSYPKLDMFDIRDEAGNWVRPRDFVGEGHDAAKPAPDLLRRYHDRLFELYRDRWQAVQQFGQNAFEIAQLVPLLSGEDSALCCWCPYDRAAQRQLRDYGSFVCHSWAVESFLMEMGVEVVRDQDRQQMVGMEGDAGTG